MVSLVLLGPRASLETNNSHKLTLQALATVLMRKESFLNKPCCVIKGTILNMKGLNVEKEMFQLVREEKSSYFLMLLVSKAPPDAQAAQLHQGQRPWRKSQERGYTCGFIAPKL